MARKRWHKELHLVRRKNPNLEKLADLRNMRRLAADRRKDN